MILLTGLIYNMSAGWGFVFLKPFNRIDKMSVAGVKSVTLWFQESLTRGQPATLTVGSFPHHFQTV